MDLEEQRREIQRLKRRMVARHAPSQFDNTESDLDRLQEENDELKLYVATLFRLLVSKGITTQDEVRSLIETIDAEDGAADGKFEGDVIGPSE